jgi:hypothetical protein
MYTRCRWGLKFLRGRKVTGAKCGFSLVFESLLCTSLYKLLRNLKYTLLGVSSLSFKQEGRKRVTSLVVFLHYMMCRQFSIFA